MTANRAKLYMMKQEAETVDVVGDNAEWVVEEERLYKKYLSSLASGAKGSTPKPKRKKHRDDDDYEPRSSSKKSRDGDY